MWTSFRPNLWLPKRSTARRCATWRASQRRSTPSDVPSPWAPGSRELEQKATAAATTSPTSRWSRTVCRVSATPTRRWAVTCVIEPRYHFFVFVEPFACVCLQAHIPVCVCVCFSGVSVYRRRGQSQQLRGGGRLALHLLAPSNLFLAFHLCLHPRRHASTLLVLLAPHPLLILLSLLLSLFLFHPVLLLPHRCPGASEPLWLSQPRLSVQFRARLASPGPSQPVQRRLLSRLRPGERCVSHWALMCNLILSTFPDKQKQI